LLIHSELLDGAHVKLHILGAGTLYADADRFGSSYILEMGGGSIMFD
jgi:ribonuclease BN (tRNA processing enzyme)